MKAWTDYIWVWVWCLIVNDDNEVLLMRRSKNCKNDVWFWTRTWWSVELNETVEDALRREVKEEIWVEIKIIKSLGYFDHILKSEKQHWVSFSFIAKITKWEIVNLEPNKCDEIKWFSLDNLPELIPQYTIDSIEVFKEMIW
ncbi:MAG: MutT/NUDIX family protein [uncultured bacterium (gcode 4)]|uniref:MutT/NUDIX family protein n=1 Tax=uncultured bacterium (gcode 4) TaxID=1234023 RepID=K2GAH9_9BACT|nr:MAG: MutT/NUDIX family protein [uncultured bacterium (gcode 4)]